MRSLTSTVRFSVSSLLTRSSADHRYFSGDLVYLDVLGKPMLILGTHDVALDLLEKRSALYSDRAQSIMIDLYVVVFPDADRNDI